MLEMITVWFQCHKIWFPRSHACDQIVSGYALSKEHLTEGAYALWSNALTCVLQTSEVSETVFSKTGFMGAGFSTIHVHPRSFMSIRLHSCSQLFVTVCDFPTPT